MPLWVLWWNALQMLRPAFSRLQTFLWFATTVAGFTVRTEHLDVTSIVRALKLMPGCYGNLIKHMHSSAVRGRLVRGIMPDQATWIAGRSTAIALFGLRDVPAGLSAGNVEALITAFRTRLVPALEAVGKARDAFARLEAKNLYSNASVAFKAYRDVAASLSAFPAGEPLIPALAAIDAGERNRLRAVIEAAGADAEACAALLKYPLIDSVPPDLAAELQRALETLKPPIHPALTAWTTKASEWIRLLARGKPPTNGGSAGGATGTGSGPSTPGGAYAGAGKSQSDALPSLLVRDAASLDATLEQLRRFASAHFAADERSIAIDVRVVDPVVTDRA
jgi:hypothetical protein